MTGKNNGSGTNGSGMAPKDSGKIVKLPTLAERDRMRKEKERLEKAAKKPAHVPFFNAGKLKPFTTIMVLAFVAVHAIIFLLLNSAQRLDVLYMMGFVPGYFTGAMGGDIPWFAPAGIFAHIFVHGSWFHLLMNATMMLALGLFFETIYGTRAAVIFFFLCALFGAALYFLLNAGSTVPLIGASGGISGLFGASLLILHERRQLGNMGRRGPWPLIAFWVVLMIGLGLFSGESIAWQAHVGGFLAGIGLIYLIQKKKIRL